MSVQLRQVLANVIPRPIRRMAPEWIRMSKADRLRAQARAQARLLLLRSMPTNAICAEIGVWQGDFSAQILSETRPAKLHLIDPWQVVHDDAHRRAWWSANRITQDEMDAMSRDVRQRFTREIASDQVAIHRVSSVDAASLFPDGHFDWVYLDADHVYEAVRADTEAWSRKVKPGGFITGDDYIDYEKMFWGAGVQRAVSEFVGGGSAELVAVHADQYILKKRSDASLKV